MKNIIRKIVVFLIVPFFAMAQKSNLKIAKPESVQISSDSLEQLKVSLHRLVDAKKLAGIQTAILRNEKLIHYDSYGYADLEQKKLLDDKSIFRIFSMTKPITSVALMQLFEQGKFKLEDPIHLYIPELKVMKVLDENNSIVPAQKAITIIDLLRHSSGISYGRSHNQKLNNLYSQENIRGSKNLEDFIKRISKLPLLFEPGTDYEYGYSTDICGYLIEVLSGKSLDQYIQENVLTPLKMKDTHFQLPNEKIQFLTTGYRTNENGKLEIAESAEQSSFASKVTFYRGGGGLVSTTNDYLNFSRMLLNKGTLFKHQILKPETVSLMLMDHLNPVRKFTPRLRILPDETGFGLGFSVSEKDGRKIYGWGGAVGTYFRLEPALNLAYIMMIQISPYRQLNLRSTFQGLVHNAIIDKPKSLEVIKPVLLDKSILSGLGLKRINLKDQPKREFFQAQLYKGKEISAYMISSSTASKDFNNFPIEEFVHLVNGSMSIKPKGRNAYTFSSNDFITIPKGFNGSIGTIGNPKYHLELSIISNKRADQKITSKTNSPILIDKGILNGENIELDENGIYENTIFSGLELDVNVVVEKPRNLIINNNPKEKCIHVLEGSLKVTLNNNDQFTFETGDFFILPKGFKGTLSSHGKNLYRSISIEAKG